MNSLSNALLSQMNPSYVTLFGFHVPQSVVISWGIVLFLTVLSALATRRPTLVPGRAQVVAEAFVTLIDDFVTDNLGERLRCFGPYMGALALYLAVSNLLGVIGLEPPTKNLNVTAGLSIMSLCLIYGTSFYCLGAKGGFRKFADPMPLMIPLNVMDMVTRPLALCMRLFGNIMGAFVVMFLVKWVTPAVLPTVFSLYFDIFDGLIQMVVFVFLTILFMKDALE